jgi:hypothetical protein
MDSNQSQTWIKEMKSLPDLKMAKKNCGRVDNPIRNKFPYWNFSKFEAEFELKFREPN